MRLARFATLMREVRDTGPMTIRDMADALSSPWDTAYHWCRVLAAEGVLAPVGFRGRAILWGLAPVGAPRLNTYAKYRPRSR